MKRQLRIIISVAVLGLSAWLMYCILWPPLPSHKGQSLEVWFQKLPGIYADTTRTNEFPSYTSAKSALWRLLYGDLTLTEGNREAFTAIQMIGTNGLPYIMSQFKPGDSRIGDWVEKLALKAGIGRRLISNKSEIRRKAATALMLIRPLSRQTLAELKLLSKNKDPEIRLLARMVLLLADYTVPPYVQKNWYDL